MTDRLSERPTSLRLPPPPEGSGRRAAYPPIPSRPGTEQTWERGRQSTSRLALVAMAAALVGAVLGSGVMIAYTDGTGRSADGPPVASAGDEVLTPTVEDGEGRGRVASVAAAVVPTVVQVNTDGGGSPLGEGGNGSGVIYRSDGYIITNNHVVGNAEEGLEVVLADGTELDAEVVGTDAANDLAVLKVDRTGLPAIQIGDSSALQVGELAVAVGSPFDLEGTVTAGVISAVNRGPIRVGVPGSEQQTMSNLIQTDAPINPGNSGGALVGGDARLIGINAAILTRNGASGNAGVGFAIPVDTAVQVADDLIQKGYVEHPFLGVEGTDVSSAVADRVGVDKGAYIEGVMAGTPADEAGLAAEDVVTALGDTPVESMDDLVVAVRDHEVGETVTITYVRGGEEHTTEATLADRPKN